MTTKARNQLYLIDAMALAYRSHFVFISRPLINSKGQNTSATYGFTNTLLKLIQDHEMEHIVVVFDIGGDRSTFRSDLFEDYKAHREDMPEELRENIPYIKKVVAALDIPVYGMAGVEADDVIGTLARKAEADGADVVIVSPDKDFRQLLSPHISVFRPSSRGEEFDIMTDETFRKEYGLEPEQFIDMLALMGDSSDNVPGVPGIGEKTAMKLLQQYGSVENLIEHAGELKGKRAREGMQNHAEAARLSKRLVTIMTDLDVPVDWHSFRRNASDEEKLRELFTELEFRTLLRRLEENGDVIPPKKEDPLPTHDPALEFDFGPYEPVKQLDEEAVDYSIIRNRAGVEKLAEQLAEQSRFAVDTETTSTDQMIASLVGLSFSWKKRHGVYVPTPLPDGTATKDVLELLRPALEGTVLKVGHNIKYDYVVLARHGVALRGPFFDTMVAHYLLAPEEPHGLDAVAREQLSYRMVPIETLIGKGKNQRSMRDVPIDDVGPYACEDADVSLRLAEVLRPELEKAGLLKIAEEIEFPLVEVLGDMERAGIRVDVNILREISNHLEAELQRLEAEIYEQAGMAFNIGSPQQLGEILFDKLGLRVVAKTSTGRPSTRESVLEELATEHPLPALILDWRHLAKLKSTYVDSLSDLVHPETKRVHTNFNQTIAATGRLSSTNPNLQNIPVRTAQGREIRKAFVPRPGWKLLAADYVQIELRILASLAGDAAMKEAFASGADIHAAAAARVYKVKPEEVTRDMRRKAKEVNYGIPYGVSPWGLAQRLRSSLEEAQTLIDQYQRSYPDIMRYLNESVEKAREKGYAETLLGRRRYVPGIHARNANERSASERIALNMPVQGTQADMIKIAMVRLHRRLEDEGYQTEMLLQVHDELVFEAPPEEIDAVSQIIREEMVAALPLDVPIEVDLDVGDNWLDAH